MTLLSVNVDHVATLRQARGTSYPSPIDAALLALEAGASGITVHLRSDRRHIQEQDIIDLRKAVGAKLNLEMAMTQEMVDIARDLQPDQVTLVPERPEEITTEGGLDLVSHGDRALDVSDQLAAEGIAVSIFLDPDEGQVRWLAEQRSPAIKGFEINTDRYSRTSHSEAELELQKIREIAIQGTNAGLEIYAGHGLTTDNVGPVAVIDQVEELNIGHFLISRAVLVGLGQAIEEMLQAIKEAASLS